MKRFFTLFILLSITVISYSQQQKYSRVKIYADENQLINLASTGIDITEGTLKKGHFLIAELSEREMLKLYDLELDYEVLIDDVSKDFVDRNIGKSTDISDYKGISEWEVPENFEFGSMSGHATWDEMIAHLDNMLALFPNLITQKESLGQTDENRDIWMVKISDNPNVNETEPEVLYTALHHAREPAGLMSLIYYMYYLLENYDNDPLIQTLVDNTEMYFVPTINADGYVYNQTTNPNGGGMWRKNRIDTGTPGCEGVDPNRNYGYMWGLDNIGSSPDPCDATYRGESPFSELETQVMRDFCEDHEFMNALNYHTYGNLLLYTWGYTEEPCEDDDLYHAHSILYTQDNNYTYGAGSLAIYPTNGGSDDWMYGEQTTKPKILAYTPELGGGGDGFWCDTDRIIPIAQENMIQNILAAAFAGKYADVEETSSSVFSETSGYISYDITRLGLVDGGSFIVTLEPLSDLIISGTEQKEYVAMELLEVIFDSIPFSLNVGTPSGSTFQFLLSLDNGDYVMSDTITKIFGEAVTIYTDDCNSFDNWISPNWDVTTSSYVSPTGSITDSPIGEYPNNHTSAAILNDEVDLTEAGYAVLNFNAKWEIEQGYDYVQLMISTNSGASWEAVAGKYTVTGNSYQAEGQPVYDGFQTEWVLEEIDLSAYIGNSITFRFLIKSDNSVTEDGFYFDDISIFVIELSPVGVNDPVFSEIKVSEAVPNPASGSVMINYSLENDNSYSNLIINNSAGQTIFAQLLDNNSNSVQIDINEWKAGIYFFRIENSDKQSETRKLIVY